MAYIAADPIAARKDLEASLQLFEQAHDAMGQLRAIVGIIAAHFVQDSSIANYARWIDLMATLFACEERVEVSVRKTPYVRTDLNGYAIPHDCITARSGCWPP